MKAQFDCRKHESLESNANFNVGDAVFYKLAAAYTGDLLKLQPKYRRPLVVYQVQPGDA